jgi:hypothetical protein
MVDRPLADSRPIGPLMDIDLDRERGEKFQLGVSGTSMPNIRKSPLNAVFVIDGYAAGMPGDIKSGTLKDKIQDKFDGSPRLKGGRSGPTASKPFDNQVITVNLEKESLPIQDAQLHMVADTIERHYSDKDLEVRTVFLDTE